MWHYSCSYTCCEKCACNSVEEYIKTKDNATIPSLTQLASATGNTVKLTMRKPPKVMDSSLINLKKQEMSPQKKRMWRTIKTLKQKLRRKEEKINSLKNLLKTRQYDNKLSSKHQATVRTNGVIETERRKVAMK
ncbi:hypothetical protein X777_06653 [Ooceraea biroi]|uniref:Uncharacterized protein n=1 Tax=Ooceraea biroi TaxID=2015173 RepID=A0A026WCF7_OOCBI|nr:hypothetical protein X777_06653 [Ooceraea biroi]